MSWEMEMPSRLKPVLIALSILILMVQPSNAFFFFFFFPIPSFGNSTSADPNEKCTSSETRAGQLIKYDGGVLRVKSILGASSKCTNDRLPILILTEKFEYEPRPLQATLSLHNGWAERPLTDKMSQRGFKLYAANTSLDIGINLSSADIRFVPDFKSTIRKIYESDVPAMTERSVSNLRSITISGLPALQWEYTGYVSGKKLTYINTYVQSKYEIVSISTWTLDANIARNRPEMIKAINSLKGLNGIIQSKPSQDATAAIKQTTASEKKPASNPVVQQSTPQLKESAVTEKLHELKKIFDNGLITSDEYAAKKKQILDGM